jgi:membrane associated rhomboid family serine protease
MAAAAILLLTVTGSLLGLTLVPQLIRWNLFRPYWFLRRREYWTLLGCGFVHADLLHLLLNATTYCFFAFGLERVIGDLRFTALYAIGLVASGAGTWLRHRREPDYASLGASGAILAVLFASIVYFPRQPIVLLPLPLPIPAPWFALAYLGYSFYASGRPRGRINHDAHWNGALAGLAFVALTDPSAFAGAWRAVLH